MDENEKKDLEAVVGEKAAKTLEKIEESVKSTHSELHEAVSQREKEIKELGGTTSATAARIAKLEDRYEAEGKELKGIIDGLKSSNADLLAQLEAKNKEVTDRLAEFEVAQKEASQKPSVKHRKDIHNLFTSNPNWKEWSLESKRNSPIVSLGSIGELRESKELTGGAALRNVFARNEFSQIFGDQLFDDVHIRDFMNVMDGQGHSYVYARRTVNTNAAAFQAEFGLKPETDFTFVETSADSKTIAHITYLSEQQIRETSQVVGYIQDEMIQGVLDKESSSIIFGDGTGATMLGIANTPGVQDYSRYVAGDTLIDSLRKSDTQLQDFRRVGNLYIINHRDWETIELAKDDEKRYLWVMVQEGGTPRMWRKPVHATATMPEGKFLNGDFRRGAFLIDFHRANLQIFPQHADVAARNMVMMRAEEAVGLAVVEPSSFVIGDYDGTGS